MMNYGEMGSASWLPMVLVWAGLAVLLVWAVSGLIQTERPGSRSSGVVVAAVLLVVGGSVWLVADDGPDGRWGPWSGMGMHGRGGEPGWVGPGWLAGDGDRVSGLAEARDRAELFANALAPDLRVGEVMRFSNHYYVELAEPDGSLVTEVLVDPRGGAVQFEFGPAMMWNTRFGMMSRGDAGAEIGAGDAREIAGRWAASRDLTVGEADAFPGYFTLHTLRDGDIDGMVSVNASTGEVWPHTWHGDFKERAE